MNLKSRILIVEDELPMRTVLSDALTGEGYRVIVAEDGKSGLEKAIAEKPDLILLDVMMPWIDGFALCAELRKLMHTGPVLMLTAKGRVEDRVRGLDAGADDYLPKPFSREELLARVRALLRRNQREAATLTELILGDIRVDFTMQRVWRKTTEVHLTVKEFGALRLLATAAGEPVTRERFLDVVWGYAAFPTTRTVDRHMMSLRAKLETDPENPTWIQTVHGVGYRLNMDPTRALAGARVET